MGCGNNWVEYLVVWGEGDKPAELPGEFDGYQVVYKKTPPRHSPLPSADPEPLVVGNRVRKCLGYPFAGVVVAAFRTVAGLDRYVVDNGWGMLHIFNRGQLQLAPPGDLTPAEKIARLRAGLEEIGRMTEEDSDLEIVAWRVRALLDGTWTPS